MKKQVIQQLQNTLEGVMQEWINTKQELTEVRIELEETQEALRRNRNQLESYKMFEKELVSLKLEYDMQEFLFKATDKVASMYENMSIWTFIKNEIRQEVI